MTEPVVKQPDSLWPHLALLALLVAGWGLFVAWFQPLPPTSDEVFYALMARNPFQGTFNAAVLPRFTQVMMLWLASLVSPDMQVAALVSGLAESAGVIFLAFDLGRRIGGVRAGWAAALLCALNPVMLSVAVRTTPDVCLALFSLGLLWLTVMALEASGRRRTGLLVLVGLLTPIAMTAKSAGVGVLPALAYLIAAGGGAGAPRRLAAWVLGLGALIMAGLAGAALVHPGGVLDLGVKVVNWVVLRMGHVPMSQETVPSLYSHWMARLVMHDFVFYLALAVCALIQEPGTRPLQRALWVLAGSMVLVHVMGMVVMPQQPAVGRYALAFMLPATVAAAPWLASRVAPPGGGTFPWRAAVVRLAGLGLALAVGLGLLRLLVDQPMVPLVQRSLFLLGPWLVAAGVLLLSSATLGQAWKLALLAALVGFLALRGGYSEVIRQHRERARSYPVELKLAAYIRHSGARLVAVDWSTERYEICDITAAVIAFNLPLNVKVRDLGRSADPCATGARFLITTRRYPGQVPCADGWRLVGTGSSASLLERRAAPRPARP